MTNAVVEICSKPVKVAGSGTPAPSPSPYLQISSSVAKPEGAAGASTAFVYTLTLVRDGSTAAYPFTWAVTGSGSNPANAADFGGTLPSGSGTFASNETTKTITVLVSGDATVEPDEQFLVTVTASATGLSPVSSTGTIQNDDVSATPMPTISISNPVSKAEGNSGTTSFDYTITLNRDGSTSAYSFTWAVTGSGSNPANASDFTGGTFPSGSGTFAAGETTKTISVPVAGDTTVEPDEQFVLTVSVTNVGTVTSPGTILNDDVSSGVPPSSAMLARYRADQPSTVTQDSSNLMSAWADVNGSGVNLAQASGTAKPLYVADSGDGQPCVRLDTGKIMRYTAASTTQAEDAFIMVVRLGDYATGADSLFARGGGPGISDTQTNWQQGNSNDGQGAIRNADPVVRNKWVILSGRRSAVVNYYPGGGGNTGTMELRENGAIIKRVVHNVGDVTATVLSIGQASGRVEIKEAIWFNRYITDNELLAMEDELNARYNVYGNVALRRTLTHGVQRWMTKTGASAPASSKPLHVLFGQSNAMGEGLVQDVSGLPASVQGPIANGLIWNPTNNAFENLQAGVNNRPNSTPAAPLIKHGIELSLMRDLSIDFGFGYLVKSGVGGTALYDRWKPTLQQTNNLWRSFVDQVENARNRAGYDSGVNLTLGYGIWYQGEADAILSQDARDTYAVNEREMLATTRSFLFGGSALKYIVPKIKDGSPVAANYQAITDAKLSNVGVIPDYQVIEGWESSAGVSGPHGNSTSMLKLGNTVAGLIGATTTTPVA
ncbi:sialate O-acetylesterase [Sphingomonas sp. LR60]|uniref:sialate O-acetylesterase n=1 Tax=Sphingomonas sp. LR60 TaxID=3050233 RepID=UPI002FE397F9